MSNVSTFKWPDFRCYMFGRGQCHLGELELGRPTQAWPCRTHPPPSSRARRALSSRASCFRASSRLKGDAKDTCRSRHSSMPVNPPLCMPAPAGQGVAALLPVPRRPPPAPLPPLSRQQQAGRGASGGGRGPAANRDNTALAEQSPSHQPHAQSRSCAATLLHQPCSPVTPTSCIRAPELIAGRRMWRAW